jgi:hypothetical protein
MVSIILVGGAKMKTKENRFVAARVVIFRDFPVVHGRPPATLSSRA